VLASAAWPALGTTAEVIVARSEMLASARDLLEDELMAIDRACSRFRPDSELSRVNAAGGMAVAASELFLEAVEVAIRAARITHGVVDPTVGRALRALGYDRDFDAARCAWPRAIAVAPASGWRQVEVDRRAGTVLVPAGVELDLGATAKALAADRAAARIARALGCGNLVNLGGDISVSGVAPPGGWRVRIADDHSSRSSADGPTVSIASGAVATSSVTVRAWTAGGSRRHHIVDPRTGLSAPVHWRTATVAAATCVDANTASTAAIVWGAAAPSWLRGLGLPSRLVDAAGRVVRVGGWPEEQGWR
jgi:thiamine biosynthesis lipoprotein